MPSRDQHDFGSLLGTPWLRILWWSNQLAQLQMSLPANFININSITAIRQTSKLGIFFKCCFFQKSAPLAYYLKGNAGYWTRAWQKPKRSSTAKHSLCTFVRSNSIKCMEPLLHAKTKIFHLQLAKKIKKSPPPWSKKWGASELEPARGQTRRVTGH